MYKQYAHHDNQGGGNMVIINSRVLSDQTPFELAPLTRKIYSPGLKLL